MKIISFQHEKVLEKVINKGIYSCSYISQYHKEAPICYQFLKDKLKEKTGIECNPVFGWANINGLPMILNKESATRANEMVGFDENHYYIFELEIPDEFICIQDFYDFACFKTDEMENIPFTIPDTISIFNSRRELQATFPYIKREWILNVYKYKTKKILVKMPILGLPDYMGEKTIVDSMIKIKL